MSTTYPCETCGSESATSDYCDMCGAAIAAPEGAAPARSSGTSGGTSGGTSPGATPPPPPAAVPSGAVPAAAPGQPGATGDTCYFCGAPRVSGDVFCEVCGLDFVSGKMPTAPDPTPVPPSVTTVGPAGASSVTGTLVQRAPSGWTAIVGADRVFFDGNVTAGVVAFPDAAGAREIPLTGDEVSIGRRSESKGYFPDVDLSSPVDDPAVSRRHAAFQRQADGSWAVVDVGSTNGTWINDEDEPLAHGVVRALHHGDRILLGAFTCITIRDDEGGPPPPP